MSLDLTARAPVERPRGPVARPRGKDTAARTLGQTLIALSALLFVVLAALIWLGFGRLVLTLIEAGGALAAVGSATAVFAVKDRGVRGVLFQTLTFGLVLLGATLLIDNTITNLASRHIATGYSFIQREARFEISESVVRYSAASSYGRALLVGFLNTLKVSIIGIALATVLGISVGIIGLSRNWLARMLAGAYVNFLRNIPILLHIILWYTVLTYLLPPLRQALTPGFGIFLSQRGLYYPTPVEAPGWWAALAGLLIAVLLTLLMFSWASKRQAKTGERFPAGWIGLGMLLWLPVLGWLIGGAPTEFSVPELKGFNFQGGSNISPEFMAVLGGLSIYTSAYIAEITRSGILAISRGQTEAGRSLGLSDGVILRKVILPQALRLMIPPTTNQFLNLTKNSSLAVSVGYPDLVSIANTTMNQTGQAIEVISIIMIVYLTTSLLTSFGMNWYNRRVQLVER